VLAARSADTLKALERELPGSLAVPTDMRDPAAVKGLIDTAKAHYGSIDVLVNNAGQGMYVPIEQIDLGDYRRILDLNVFGVLVAMQAAIPALRAEGGGVIVNVSSMVSKMYIPGLAAYASTKYALNAISLTARAELEPDNIRVGIVYPRLTATSFGANALGVPRARRPAAPAGQSGQPTGMPEPDPPELVAEAILDAIDSERAETYVGGAQEP
jgi:short-subunit dehydrogenase